MSDARNDLSTNVAAFCATLRTEHGFRIGLHETLDAMRALEAIGVSDGDRVRAALRLICCGTHAQTQIFDRAFDVFFFAPRPGVPQPAYAARNARPGRDKLPPSDSEFPTVEPNAPVDEDTQAAAATAAQRREVEGEPDEGSAARSLRARYSPQDTPGDPLRVDPRPAASLRSAAQRIVQSVRLGRSRRWKALDSGRRFDLRRTIRASLKTGGDPVALRFLGHPLRNPRFVVLIDGSRSMAEYTAVMIAFTAALCACSARVKAFVFSTALRDVSADLRAAFRTAAQLTGLGEAWGGGTKIGASLAAFVAEYGPRLLSPETVVIVFSDGLDVGDIAQLERALRDIDRRSAGIVWLNPHVATPGFAPTARGMRAARPFISLLCAANDARGFETLAGRIAQTARIRGRRG